MIRLTKIRCPWILCKFNTSYVREKPGKCTNSGDVELKVANLYTIPDLDYIPDGLDDAELMICDSFIHSKVKENSIIGV